MSPAAAAPAPSATSAAQSGRIMRWSFDVAIGSPHRAGDGRALGHLVGRHGAPGLARRVGVRPLVGEVDVVAVDREHEAVLVEPAGCELQPRLHHLPELPAFAVAAEAEDAARAPVAGEMDALHPAVVGHAEALHRAAALGVLGAARPGRVVRILRGRQHADHGTAALGRVARHRVPEGRLHVRPAIVLAPLQAAGCRMISSRWFWPPHRR